MSGRVTVLSWNQDGEAWVRIWERAVKAKQDPCVNETEAGGKVNMEEAEEFKYLGSKATDSAEER